MGTLWSSWWFKYRWKFIWTNAIKEGTNNSDNIAIQTPKGMNMPVLYCLRVEGILGVIIYQHLMEN